MLYTTVKWYVVHFRFLHYSIGPCSSIEFHEVHYKSLQYSTVLCSNVQFPVCTVLVSNTVQYNTVQLPVVPLFPSMNNLYFLPPPLFLHLTGTVHPKERNIATRKFIESKTVYFQSKTSPKEMQYSTFPVVYYRHGESKPNSQMPVIQIKLTMLWLLTKGLYKAVPRRQV